ncbi:MAG: ABC transporter permease [Bacillati bacterium ANGP1]|uniref:ABC transporter permease n=1 Tax=Candidatus Segetimicrobium genomatis TaxID=2569760 RepID=A0A537K372_9BACT|nr:MAG: ABC transporter permease [Terrabacteria group bacterium ANGP1]
MTRYLAGRVAALLPVLLAVGVTAFLLLHLIPGDPAAVILGPDASAAQVARLRHALGLDRPLAVQLALWLGRLLRGNLGDSIFLRQTVAQAIWQHLGPTAGLTALAEMLAIGAAIPSGVLAAWKRHSRFDQVFMSAVLLGVSIPSFWMGLNLIAVFAVAARWFPVAGYESPLRGVGPWLRHLLLPALALAFTQAGLIARMARDATIEILDEDYIRTARSKGVADAAVLLRHALRNALIPTVTVIGTSLANLLSGAVVVESVFVLPGIGSLVIQSVSRRDYPVIEGVVLFAAAVYVLLNLAVDLLYAVIDPRVRY